MNADEPTDIEKIFEEGTAIDDALKRAVRDALRAHKRMGNPIVGWRDGHVIWIPPDEIEIPEEPEESKS